MKSETELVTVSVKLARASQAVSHPPAGQLKSVGASWQQKPPGPESHDNKNETDIWVYSNRDAIVLIKVWQSRTKIQKQQTKTTYKQG